ncbi:MAG: peptidoglycan DD-metalloendopeptidase family protein [Deltaproteobacteria bacterium]|nr:peptidoglycan DD-metalloendopeptidase family protein [Deltaproteobacteria bacterium]
MERIPAVAACLAAFAWLALATPVHAADTLGKLRQEKARLTEMKQKAEKAAAELAETLRREKLSRNKVLDLETRLAKQRKLIARIDRKLSDLGTQMDRAEREVRALEEEQGKARRGISGASLGAFAGYRDRIGAPAGAAEERARYFARRLLLMEIDRYGRLSADREEKERVLTGIERRIEDSERRMEEQRKVGEKLVSRQEKERKRLAEIERNKKEKAKELRALKARIARMETLVSRIERRVREKERRAKESARKGPNRFGAVVGGLAPPIEGKLVGRFGKQRDPVFDVTIENRGVEIEAASGALVHAIGGGEVVFVGSVPGFGKVLILQHGSGLFSVYGKAEDFSVKQGQSVAKGEAVGRLPASPEGKSVLYLELRAGGTAIDPVPVIPIPR